MRVYRLLHHDVTRFDSSGVGMDLVPAVLGAEAVQVNVAHVTAGGTLGEHPATALQVLAVVSGEAVVASRTAGDVERRELGAGHAVVWQPGEVHQTWAVTDVVAVVVEAHGDAATLDLDEHFVELGEAGGTP